MNQPEIIQLSRNPVKLLIWFVIGLGLVWLVWNLVTTVLVFSLAALTAYLIVPLVTWLSSKNFPLIRKKLPRSLSVLVIYLLLMCASVFSILYFAPIIISQIGLFAANFPFYLHKMESAFGVMRLWYTKLRIPAQMENDLKLYGQAVLEKITPALSTVAERLIGGVLALVEAMFVIIAAFLVSLYIVLDEKNIRQHLVDMFPESWRKDTEELMHDIGHVVGAFIRGEIILSLTVGIGSYLILLSLRFFGIRFDYALLAGIVIAILYPIPFIGVWGPRLLIPVLAFFQPGGWIAAISVFAVLTGVGLVVDNVLLPVMMGKGVGISPLMVLLVIFAGGELFGIWGLVLGVPIAAVIRLVFFYLQKRVTI